MKLTEGVKSGLAKKDTFLKWYFHQYQEDL